MEGTWLGRRIGGVGYGHDEACNLANHGQRQRPSRQKISILGWLHVNKDYPLCL